MRYGFTNCSFDVTDFSFYLQIFYFLATVMLQLLASVLFILTLTIQFQLLKQVASESFSAHYYYWAFISYYYYYYRIIMIIEHASGRSALSFHAACSQKTQSSIVTNYS